MIDPARLLPKSMRERGPAPRDQEALAFIREYWEKNGEAPLYKEIAASMKVHTTTAQHHVVELAKLGLVKLTGRWRGIEPA